MKNLTIRGPLPAALCLCAHFLLCSSAEAGAPFTTVINVPADPAPAYIGSDTQLNLFDGGGLPDNFSLGDQLYGPNTHIQVNINGGTVGNGVNIGMPDIFPLSSNDDIVMNVYGGTIGHGLTVNADSTLNFYGGTIGPDLEVDSGATVNLFSGSLGDNIAPKNGSTFNISGGTIGSNFAPENNTTVNISGGKIGDFFSLGYNTTVNISGGVVPEIIYVGGGGVLNLSGGNIGAFYANGTDTTITGSEFMLDGVPIAGLNGPGDSVTIPTSGSARLTTTFADGAVFTSVPGNLGDTLTLVAVAAPPKPHEINSPSDPVPLGLRAGQTLNLGNGAELVDNFVAVDATLNITGGTASDHLITLGTEVHISDGPVGDYYQARSGSTVNISGGHVGLGFVLLGSDATVANGNVGSNMRVNSSSSLELTGGTVGPYFRSDPGSSINIHAGDLRLNGEIIPSLMTPGDSAGVNLADGSILTGVLSDGSPFVFSSQSGDNIADGTLAFTVVTAPVSGANVINVPGSTAPSGLRPGQVLNLAAGGSLGDNFAAIDAEMNIAGGTTGVNMETVHSTVYITDGVVGSGFLVLAGSLVDISGGKVGDSLQVLSGSTVHISGGEVGERLIAGIPGGTSADVTVNISGGTIGKVPQFYSGATANISGGIVDVQFHALAGSTINLIGQTFILDGINLASILTPGVAMQITGRDIVLEGVLADGQPFNFDLNSRFSGSSDIFDPNAMLTVTLVPESGTFILFIAGGLAMIRNKRH